MSKLVLLWEKGRPTVNRRRLQCHAYAKNYRPQRNAMLSAQPVINVWDNRQSNESAKVVRGIQNP
jgi:hypothetical protein